MYTRSRQYRTPLALGLLWALLVGCTQQTSPGPPAHTQPPSTATSTPTTRASADPQSVTWMGRFCTAVGAVEQSIRDATNGPEPHTPDELKNTFSRQLGAATTGLTTAAHQLGELGASPISGGDQAIRDLAAKFTNFVEPFTQTKNELDALPAGSSETDIGRVMAKSGPTLGGLTSKPLDQVEINQDLKTAGDQSPTCRSKPWWTLVGK